MPLYTVNYRMQFKDINGTDCFVDIEDRASPEGSPLFTTLKHAGDPLHIETVNNSQDPFAPILAKSATIRFLSTSSIHAGTFSQGTDDRFYVKAYTFAAILFEGFLLMDDIAMPFLPPAFHQTVTLVATDNIGTLKELELVDNSTGAALTDGHYSNLYYVQSCLKRTGLSLNLNIVFNVFEESFTTDQSPLYQTFTNSLTFEKDLTTKQDCYTILQGIMSSLKCRLFQYRGEWWIVRLHEYRTSADTVQVITYSPGGTKAIEMRSVAIRQNIQGGGSLRFINADGEVVAQRPNKFVKDVYRFETPLELIRNIDFTRGAEFGSASEVYDEDYNPDLDSDNINELFGYSHSYHADHWTLLRSSGGSYVDNNTTAYIKRVIDLNGVEDARELVMTAGTPGNQYYLVSEEVPIHKNDKFNTSVDFRFSGNISGTSGQSFVPVMQIRLTDDDGSKWLLNDGAPAGNNNRQGGVRWVNVSVPGTFINLAHFVYHYWDVTQQDERQWMSVSVEAPPMPVDGNLQVVLMHANPTLSYTKSFANLQFEYLPNILNTYAKYAGQSNKITQPQNFKAKEEGEAALSDSPKKIFKGALKKWNGTAHVLTGNWTDGFDSGTSGSARLGKILAFDVWNQYRISRTMVNGTVAGVGDNLAYCLLPYKFILNNYDPNKYFICLYEDVNVKKATATGGFIEVFDTSSLNDYSTIHEFNYTQ